MRHGPNVSIGGLRRSRVFAIGEVKRPGAFELTSVFSVLANPDNFIQEDGVNIRDDPEISFSLVVATINRTNELGRLLRSLVEQHWRMLDVIVVDQNPDDRLVPLLEEFSGTLNINHLRDSRRGLSRARNTGLLYARRDIVAFPDDDCWYPANLLRSTARIFEQHSNIDGLTGISRDESGKPSAARWGLSAGPIRRNNVWERAVSVSVFLRRHVVEEVGGFDETLGVGADTLWGSGEETDLLLRALEAGFRLYYDPEIIVHHPSSPRTYDVVSRSRAYQYGMGMGRVLRKHGYSTWFVFYMCLRQLGATVLSLLAWKTGKPLYHWALFRGRFRGWFCR